MRIALLTPSRDGRAHLDHCEAVTDARFEAVRRGVSLKRYVGKGSSNLPRNRNLLAAQALKDGADVLIWIDCDIAFDPADVFRLAESKADIVAALPQARTHVYGEPARIAGVGVEREPDETGYHPAKAVPTAFMATKRHVYERMIEAGKATNFTCPASDKELWPYLHNWFFYRLRPSDHDPEIMQDDAEDYYFCNMWREMGGKVHAAPDVRLHHFEGLVRHSLCMDDLWRAQDGSD
jgi:glycosyltransferase involved in cell wall biosynthesis